MPPVFQRLSAGWMFVVESVVAASLAWLIATSLLGVRPESFFAPASTMLVLGQIRGQRVRRALEVWGGVVVGILTAHLLRLLAEEPLVTVAGAVLVLSLLAVATNANAVVVVQGSVSALYVAVGPAVAPDGVSARLIDVLIGGGCALVVSQAFTGTSPVRRLRRDLNDTLAEIGEVLADVRRAAGTGDAQAALDALERSRRLDTRIGALKAGVRAVHESAWLRWGRRAADGHEFLRSLKQLDYAVRSVRVLARSGVILARSADPLPADLDESLSRLTLALENLTVLLEPRYALDGSGAPPTPAEQEALQAQVKRSVLQAVESAGRGLGQSSGLATAMMIGQIRALAVDLLRLAGDDHRGAPDAVDAALAAASTAAAPPPVVVT